MTPDGEHRRAARLLPGLPGLPGPAMSGAVAGQDTGPGISALLTETLVAALDSDTAAHGKDHENHEVTP